MQTVTTLLSASLWQYSDVILSLYQALAQAGEQAAASAGEDETLARLQLDEVNAAISNSEQELTKLSRFAIVLWDINKW